MNKKIKLASNLLLVVFFYIYIRLFETFWKAPNYLVFMFFYLYFTYRRFLNIGHCTFICTNNQNLRPLLFLSKKCFSTITNSTSFLFHILYFADCSNYVTSQEQRQCAR